MNYKEKKKEEAKKQRKEELPEEKTVKECSVCKTINELNAKFCQECGNKFFEEEIKTEAKKETPLVQEKKDEKGEGKKEEVKEKKKSFFSRAQMESIRKSEEEMKNKEETIKVKAVEVREVQKAVYVADRANCRIQKFNSEGEFITKWGREGSGNGEFYILKGIAILIV